MTTELTPLQVVDGFYVGPVRTPRNRASAAFRAQRGGPAANARSIHDDETAQALGFRGGTIAGSIHLDQFPPLLVAAFGEHWFETGSISLQFKNATVDAEPVVAFVGVPEGGARQVRARMERTDGLLVAEGTAGVDEVEPTHLHAIDLRPASEEALRILAGIRPGAKLEPRTFTVDAEAQRERVEQGAMTEPLSWYTGPSPWGPPIVPLSAIVQVIRNGPDDFGPNIKDAVGLFSAIELRFWAGPLRCGTTYQMRGEVVACGASPKTEYVWYDSRATDEAGTVVVSMRMQLRWMKASSPLYQPAT
jgi:hypothetical protein